MKTEYCPDYVGVACVDGTCPVANYEEYAERCMPVISSCRNCFYYRAVKTVQSLTIATEWRINMSKKCVCGNEMTREDWKHEWVCHRCGRKRPIPLPPMFTVFMCRKCEHLLYVEEDEDFPQKLGKIAAKSCPCCGEQEEGLWRLLGRAEGFEGTVFTEESDED